LNQTLADKIKNMIDENMFKEVEKLAKQQGFSTEGWFRHHIWELIRQQRTE
jgi:tRNA A37 N6-isopentenylltransferase MiaA